MVQSTDRSGAPQWLFLAQLEEEILQPFGAQLAAWYCFIDDVFLVWLGDMESLKTFVDVMKPSSLRATFHHRRSFSWMSVSSRDPDSTPRGYWTLHPTSRVQTLSSTFTTTHHIPDRLSEGLSRVNSCKSSVRPPVLTLLHPVLNFCCRNSA